MVIKMIIILLLLIITVIISDIHLAVFKKFKLRGTYTGLKKDLKVR